MRYINFRSTALFTSVLMVFFLTGCLKKNDATYTDFSQLQDHVILRSAGLSNLKSANINVDNTSTTPDSIEVFVELASVNASSSNVNVTLDVDNNIITTYNAANNTNFQPFPTGSFQLVTNTLTITAGNHYASTYLILDQTKFDPSVSYMLPVIIKDASGKALTSNQNTIYFNIIGNPIAGQYTQEWIRWNNATGTGDPAFDETFTGTFAPVSPTTISAESGTGVLYLVSFTNTNGVLSNFTVTFDAQSVTDAAITITSGPTITTADPANGKFEFTFQYNNSSGAARTIIDKFTK